MTKKKKPQGKISEKIILRELLKDKPLKLKEIAVKAGSLAKNEDAKSGAVMQKVMSSTKLQEAFSKARNRGLEVSNFLLDSYETKINENDDISKVSSKDRLDGVVRVINTISSLTKEENTNKTGDTSIVFNIIAPKGSVVKPIESNEPIEGEIVE